MNKLTLSILTAIIIFPSINSFAAFAKDTRVDRYHRLEHRKNYPTRKKLKHRYHDKVRYQRRVSNIMDRYKKKSAVYNSINRNLQQLDAGGGTHYEYNSGF